MVIMRKVCLIFDIIGNNLGDRVLLHEVKYPNKRESIRNWILSKR